ncbi:hypothetical protein B0H12DRAFT_852754 [Mycena haematopus]|nr:hypothetical protein B0H12DRAFT_852754 [Mycena haematopus]
MPCRTSLLSPLLYASSSMLHFGGPATHVRAKRCISLRLSIGRTTDEDEDNPTLSLHLERGCALRRILLRRRVPPPREYTRRYLLPPPRPFPGPSPAFRFVCGPPASNGE